MLVVVCPNARWMSARSREQHSENEVYFAISISFLCVLFDYSFAFDLYLLRTNKYKQEMKNQTTIKWKRRKKAYAHTHDEYIAIEELLHYTFLTHKY